MENKCMTPHDASEPPKPESPKIRFRSPSETWKPESATPPTPPPEPASPGPSPEERQQMTQASRTLSAWGDVEPISIPAAKLLFVVLGVVLAVAGAVQLARNTAAVTAVIAFAVTAALGRLAGLLRLAGVPKQAAGLAAAASGVTVLGLLLLAGGPAWQRQAAQYGARLTALAGQAAGVAQQHDVAESGQWLTNCAGAVEHWINYAAAAVMNRRLFTFFQLALFIGAFTALGILRSGEPRNALGKIWGGIAGVFTKFFAKLGFWMASRLAKAALLAILTGITLQLAGVAAAWFIATIIFLLAIVMRSVAVVVLVLAAPMIPWSGAWQTAGGIVLGTGVVLFFAEKKLHWYLYLRPALAAGMILPEVHGGDTAGGVSGLFGSVGKIVRFAIWIVSAGLVAGALWVLVPSWQERNERDKALTAADNLVASNPAAATNELVKLAVRYPNEPGVLLGLARAHVIGGDFSNATRYAEAYATWEPKPEQAATLQERLYDKFLSLVPVEKPAFNRAAGYEAILKADRTDPEKPEDSRRDLAAKIVDLNPDSFVGLNVLANETLQRSQPDQTIEYAQRGLTIAPRDSLWHVLLANAYLQKKDWAKVIIECDAVLALNPSDDRMQSLRTLAERAQKQTPAVGPAP